MPKATFTRVLANSDDATFRQWCTDLSTALKACLTQTADTGQVDWSLGTQVRPGSGTFGYYEMYRFSDALQATKPVFIKVDYGSGSPQTTPSVRLAFASGTNGAGTLTGLSYLPSVSSSNSTPGVPAATTYVCAKDGYFGIMLWATPSPSIGFPHLSFMFDRSRDPSGVGTGNGFYWCYHNGASGVGAGGCYSLDLAASQAIAGAGNCMPPNYTGATSVAAKTKLFPHRIFTPDEYAITGCLSYLAGEITQYTEFDVAPLPGMATQRYLSVGGMWHSNVVHQVSSWFTAMRYET